MRELWDIVAFGPVASFLHLNHLIMAGKWDAPINLDIYFGGKTIIPVSGGVGRVGEY